MSIAPLNVGHIAAVAGGTVVHGDADSVVTGVALDSRQVRPGDLFVAIVGERTDGHQYAQAAAAAGAACLLVRRDRWPLPATAAAGTASGPLGDRAPGTAVGDLPPGTAVGDLPSGTAVVAVADPVAALGALGAHHRQALADLTVVGVTGSVGKTSTKDMIAGVLDQGGPVLKNPGNLNSEFSLPLVLLGLEARHRYAVLEMGMRARGDIKQLCAIADPQIGVVTNIGISHLELLGSQHEIALAKAELLEALPASGRAVLPVDDPWYGLLAERSAAPVLPYGLGPAAAVTAREIEPDGLHGIAFTLCLPDGTVPVRLPVPGEHQVVNALAAAAAGHAAGLSPAQIAAGLGQLQPSGQRTAVYDCGGISVIDDTYNASPASMAAALDLLAAAVRRDGGRAVAVLGDMYELGAEAEAGHRATGAKAAATGVDVLVAVGSLGRLIGEGAREAGLPAAQTAFAADNAEAIALLRERLRPGDTVLVKGSRGMQMEEIVAALCPDLDAGG